MGIGIVNGNEITPGTVPASALSLDAKNSVRVATAAALPTNTLNVVPGNALGITLAATANGALPSVDGVTLTVGDDVLVKDEGGASPATDAKNGIYVVESLGSVSTPWVLVRRSDANSSAPSGIGGILQPGATVVPREGSQASVIYIATGAEPFILDVTPIGFTSSVAAGVAPTFAQVNAALGNANAAVTVGNAQPLALSPSTLPTAVGQIGVTSDGHLATFVGSTVQTVANQSDPVANLQGVTVSNATPAANDVLTYSATSAQWLPQAPASTAPTFAQVNSALGAANTTVEVGNGQGLSAGTFYAGSVANSPNAGLIRIPSQQVATKIVTVNRSSGTGDTHAYSALDVTFPGPRPAIRVGEVGDGATTNGTDTQLLAGNGGTISLFAGTSPSTASLAVDATSATFNVPTTVPWGGSARPVAGFATTSVKTSNYNAVAGDVVRCDNAGGANVQVTLPSASANPNAFVWVKKQSASTLGLGATTVVPTLGDTVNGAPSETVTAAKGCHLYMSDGVSDWMLVANV